MKKLSLLVAGILLVGPSLTCTAQDDKPKVKIGPDTTVIDGPLTKDGYIDYVAHLNKILSKGVTAQNNAAVLLLKASPGEIGDERYMKRYCKALGIAPIPLEGDYFQDYYRYSFKKEEEKTGGKLSDQKRNEVFEKVDKEYGHAMEHPWKKDEFPEIAKWIEKSEKHFDLVRKASLRSRYYHPMLNGDDEEFTGVIAVLLPQAQSSRAYARAFSARAMMYLGEGEYDKCFEDLLTMRRLGNHIASGATIVEQLVGIAIIGIAQNVELKAAFSGKLSAEQLLDYRAKMHETRAKTNMLRSFTNCERFMYLDAVQQVMRGGLAYLNAITGSGEVGGKPKTSMQKMLDQVVTNSTDWSITMREGNRFYDEFEEGMKSDDWIEQKEALRKMEDEIKKISESVQGTSAMMKAMLGGPEYRGELMGKVFVSLLVPALNAASTAEKRVQVRDDLVYIALSAAAHKVNTGEFPASIRDFAGKAGSDLPIDKYANEAYRYKRIGDGVIVYSIGPNQKDDNGDGVYNEKYGRTDDIGAGYETLEKTPTAAASDIN